jgi:GxxExxY protein
MNNEIIERELSYKIVQAAYEVFNGLGPGFLEKIYEEAMIVILEKRGYALDKQKPSGIHFMEKQVSVHILDLVVNNRVILELKAVAEILPVHKQQALSYLKATGLPLAILINFGAHRLQVERVVLTKHRKNSRSSLISRLSR